MRRLNYPNKIRRRHIIKLALPIIFGMLSFNILDIVDTAMIGTLGNNALAATGFAGFLFFVCFSVFIGNAAAIQSIAARRFGENKFSECGVSLNAGLILMSSYAIPISIIAILLAPFILGLFSTDPDVLLLSVTYFRWRVVGLFAIGVTISFRGFWNGIKEPNTYTIILVGIHVLNIFLNWVLIFGNLGFPALGVKGAAMASSISLYVGGIAYIIVTFLKKSSMGVLIKCPSKLVLKRLITIGWPLCLDSFLFSLHLLCLFWIFGQMGTVVAAIVHVVIICDMILWLPGIGFGMASLSLVGEALGKGNTKDAKQWAWDIIKFAIPIIFFTGVILFSFPTLILKQFIYSPSTLKMAIFPLRLDLLTLWIACIGTIIMESLTGAGSTRTVMIVKTISRWGLLIPGAYFVGVYFGYGINGVWIYWVGVTIIETLTFVGIWQRERWTKIKV